MKSLLNIGISFLFSIGFLLVLTFILTLFNYFDIINNGLFIFFEILNLILSLFIGGFIIGKKSLKKGWLEGLKLGIFFVIFLILLNYLGFNSSINLKFIVFSLIIVISSIFGGMFGISLKDSKK